MICVELFNPGKVLITDEIQAVRKDSHLHQKCFINIKFMVFCHHQLNYLLKRQVPRTEHASVSSRHRVKNGSV